MQQMKLEHGTVKWSDATDGHLGVDAVDRPEPAVFLHQVHGTDVVVVGKLVDDVRGDASITTKTDLVLAIKTADCAPVALLAPEMVAGVHAGWMGLAGDVIGATVAKMREMGASNVVGALGPCIHACCYEFGEAQLDQVIAASDDSVRSTTRSGATALDVPAAVRVQLQAADAAFVYQHPDCTGCSDKYFSHRMTGTKQRQATFVQRA